MKMNLSLEQKLSIRQFNDKVKQMSHEQAQEFLLYLYQQMLIRENQYKDIIKHQWGIEK